MLSFLFSFFLFFAETAAHGGEAGFYDKYLNYPGFEAWKFLNLGIFIAIMIYLLRKPLSASFKQKRDEIRADLIKAEEAKQAAKAELESAQTKLANIDAERREIMENARAEAETERKRLEKEAEAEISRVRAQAETEVSRKTAQVNVQLRRFSAEESIRLAEEKIRSSMNLDTDSRLIDSNVESIGGLQ